MMRCAMPSISVAACFALVTPWRAGRMTLSSRTLARHLRVGRDERHPQFGLLSGNFIRSGITPMMVAAAAVDAQDAADDAADRDRSGSSRSRSR